MAKVSGPGPTGPDKSDRKCAGNCNASLRHSIQEARLPEYREWRTATDNKDTLHIILGPGGQGRRAISPQARLAHGQSLLDPEHARIFVLGAKRANNLVRLEQNPDIVIQPVKLDSTKD